MISTAGDPGVDARDAAVVGVDEFHAVHVGGGRLHPRQDPHPLDDLNSLVANVHAVAARSQLWGAHSWSGP
jgi:hypothetical protein